VYNDSVSWIFIAFLAGVCSNASNFFSRVILTDEADTNIYAWFFEFVRVAFFGVLIFFDYHLIVSIKNVLLLLGMGMTEFISIYFYMKMHAYSHLSISTVISRTRLIWTPIIAFILLKEELHVITYIGIGILFLGLLIATSPKKLIPDKGQIYAHIASFIIAVNIVQTKMNTPFASNSVLLVFMALPTALLFPLLMKKSVKRIKHFFRKNILIKVLSAVANIGAIYLFTVAVRVGSAGIVTALYQSAMILSVLAGIFLLHEKQDIKRKLFGSFITLVGVLILSFV